MSEYQDNRALMHQVTQYLAEQRETFPDDPWRYTPNVAMWGVPLTILNGAELRYWIKEQQRQRKQMESWPTPSTPEQYAAVDARIRAAKDALRIVGQKELEAETA